MIEVRATSYDLGAMNEALSEMDLDEMLDSATDIYPTSESGDNSLPRIGILVVAYNAESTLASVLDRVPKSFRPRISEVFVCDDASGDSTYLVGLGYKHLRTELPLEHHPPPAEPRVRRQPEGWLPDGDRQGAGHHRDAPR